MNLLKRILLKIMLNSYKEMELSSYVLHLNIKDSYIKYQTNYVSCNYKLIIKQIKTNGVFIDNLWINSNVIESIELIEIHKKNVSLDLEYLVNDYYNYTNEQIKELNDKYHNIVNQYNKLKEKK